MLLLTTVYLFHLHHAPEDNASNLWHNLDGDSHSPGGSALRHKMDLAHFLLQKYDREHGEEAQREAARLGGWKGGNEENFIKMVNDLSHEDHPQPQGDSDKAETKPRPKVVDDKSITRLAWAELQ